SLPHVYRRGQVARDPAERGSRRHHLSDRDCQGLPALAHCSICARLRRGVCLWSDRICSSVTLLIQPIFDKSFAFPDKGATPMAEQFSRRTFLRVAAVSSFGLALAACAPAPAPAASETAAEPATGEVATVRFHSRVGVQGDYYAEMAEKFNEEHPDINVVLESFPGENPEYLQK